MKPFKKYGTVSFEIKQPDPVNVYLDEENVAFFCINEILQAAGLAGTNASHWATRLRKQSSNYMPVLRRGPLFGQADAWFIRADSLALLASAQPKSSIHARRAMVELAKAWNEVKKDFPQPQKREPERNAPLLRFNTETAPNAPPLVVNGGWADVAITV